MRCLVVDRTYLVLASGQLELQKSQQPSSVARKMVGWAVASNTIRWFLVNYSEHELRTKIKKRPHKPNLTKLLHPDVYLSDACLSHIELLQFLKFGVSVS